MGIISCGKRITGIKYILYLTKGYFIEQLNFYIKFVINSGSS